MLFLLFFQPKFLFPSFCLPPVHGSPRAKDGDSSASQARHEYGDDEHRELEEPVLSFSGLVLCFDGEDAPALEEMAAVFRVQAINEDFLLYAVGVKGGGISASLPAVNLGVSHFGSFASPRH
jgi:hypothetical protein